MSYYYLEKLDLFADLATESELCEHRHYWDTSDPDNINAAQDFFDKELDFLSQHDKKELYSIWNLAIKDCRCIKLLFNAIKVLKDKYEQ